MLRYTPMCTSLLMRKARPEVSSTTYTATQQTRWEWDFTIGVVLLIINLYGGLHPELSSTTSSISPNLQHSIIIVSS